MLQIRPYQEDAITKIIAEWGRVDNTLLVLPTGGGKTVVFLELLNRVLTGNKRGLVIAHRKELIEQPIERIGQFWPHLAEHAGVVMASSRDVDAKLIVATIQTLATPGRLEEILAHGPIDYVVTDEAHHAVAASYKDVYARLGKIKHVGVTATPGRGDGAGLIEVFQSVAAKYSIKDLIKWGYLVPPRWLAIQTGISLAGVSKHSGDFTQKELADVYEVDNCFDLVVESHKKFGGERRAIAFVTSVDGAYRLAEKFNEAGVTAAAADGTTAKSDRAGVLADFRAGKTQVLCNVALWTEGLDVPEIDLIHMVRPTRSDGLYLQMMGRGLRPVPGKQDCLILDYAPAESRDVVMAGDVLGVAAKKEVYVKKDAEPGDVIAGFTYDGKSTKWLDGSPYELISRQLDYMSASPWVWTRYDNHLILPLGPSPEGVEWTLVISGNKLLGVARSTADTAQHVKDLCNKAYVIKEGDFEALSEVAEDIAEKRGNKVFIAKGKQWRRQPPTESQVKFARKLKVYQPGMSKGQVAEMITAKLALQIVHPMI